MFVSDSTGRVSSAFSPFVFNCFYDDFQGFRAFPSAERWERVCKRKYDGFIFVEVRVKKGIDFSFKFCVMTRVGVVRLAEPAEEGCIEFSHGGFVVIDPNVFFV